MCWYRRSRRYSRNPRESSPRTDPAHHNGRSRSESCSGARFSIEMTPALHTFEELEAALFHITVFGTEVRAPA